MDMDIKMNGCALVIACSRPYRRTLHAGQETTKYCFLRVNDNYIIIHNKRILSLFSVLYLNIPLIQ